MERRKRVLLVEDSPLLLAMERSFFSRAQVEVTVARSGREALQVLEGLRPELVMMDFSLPDLDGAEVCRRIKASPEFLTLPVILVPDSRRPAEEARCREAGCDAIVTRPVDRRELLLVARSFLELASRAAPRVRLRMLVGYGVAGSWSRHDLSANLSVGGLFLETPGDIPSGTELELEFLLPGAAVPVRCRGRVVWLNLRGNKTKPGLPAGVGIRFTELADRDARLIRSYVHRACRPAGQEET